MDENGFDGKTHAEGELVSSRQTPHLGEDKEILGWVLAQRDLNLSMSVESIQAYARQVVNSKRPEAKFIASRNWAVHFMNRHSLVLRSKTSIAQKLPAHLEEKTDSFISFIRQKTEEYEIDERDIVNVDETPAYFNMVYNKRVAQKGQNSVVVRTTSGEKRHTTIVMGISASGDVLPPMVIFKGKRELKLSTPPGSGCSKG